MKNQHIFYTTSDTNNSLINQIEIDFENATYNVWYDIENYLSDDHIFDDNDNDSTYVSDDVFHFILEGLDALGYSNNNETSSDFKIIYYTGTNRGRGFDILVQNDSTKSFALFFNAIRKDLACSVDCPVSFCLKKGDFKKKITKLQKLGYKNDINVDVSNYVPNRWERFYTDAKNGQDYVDQIEIDEKSQKYVLFLNADENITYEYDVFGQEIYSTYVSRRVFDLILDGVKSKGYKKLDENDDFRKN